MKPGRRTGRRWWRYPLAAAAGGGLILAGSTGWLASFGGCVSGERLERAKRSPHYRGGRFRNLVPTKTLLPGSVGATLRNQFLGSEIRVPQRPIPIARPGRGAFDVPPASGLRATWMGHATVLIEIDGRRILTDPVWSDRASPSTLLGPKRFFPPPVPLVDLPPIDAAVISHDHYDHLDMTTVRFLAARGTVFVVPLGIGAHLERWGVPEARRVELDWGESFDVGGVRLEACPARHYSGRLYFGDPTLWASWAVLGPKHRVYYSGDSGYFKEFRRVGSRLGPFDLTLVKIGAYGPTWPEIHMTPEEAVQAHLDVRGGALLPVHWGTFNLAPHDWREPADRVVAAAADRGVRLCVPRPGERIELAGLGPIDPWWRAH
jgi:L-ascorbate metabolism protein UlaG (beta-lactamase superfamily)